MPVIARMLYLILFLLLAGSSPLSSAEERSSDLPPAMVEDIRAGRQLSADDEAYVQRMVKKRNWNRMQVAEHIEACWKVAVKQENRREEFSMSPRGILAPLFSDSAYSGVVIPVVLGTVFALLFFVAVIMRKRLSDRRLLRSLKNGKRVEDMLRIDKTIPKDELPPE